MDKDLRLLKRQQEEVFTSIASILNGISSPVRVKLIHFLSQGPLSVETLAKKIEQSVANTSMHLRKMLSLKIVNVLIQGKNRIYVLNPAGLSFWESCQDFIQEIDPGLRLDIESVYEEMSWTQDLKTTINMIKNNEVLLLDVRPSDEVGGDMGKLNINHIPASEITKNLKQLPKNKPVLVFCRGRFCALSASAVSELRKQGVQAFRLNQSWYSLLGKN